VQLIVLGGGKFRKFFKTNLCVPYRSPRIVRILISKTLEWFGYVNLTGGNKECRGIFYEILFQITFLELREEERRITLRHILRNSVVVMTGGAGS
jgi:hypothetical protein